MSRAGEDYYENFPNEAEFWVARARTALRSKRGRKALADLREALMALPEHRLISRALCTAGAAEKAQGAGDWRKNYIDELLSEQGVGVCAVGAYAWHQKVKAGADPTEAMRSLPLLDDEMSNIDDTARYGEAAGLTFTLAYVLADANDESFAGCTPEERWERFVKWIDQMLGTECDSGGAS